MREHICRSESACTQGKRRLLSSMHAKGMSNSEGIAVTYGETKKQAKLLAIFWCTLRDSNSQPLVP